MIKNGNQKIMEQRLLRVSVFLNLLMHIFNLYLVNAYIEHIYRERVRKLFQSSNIYIILCLEFKIDCKRFHSNELDKDKHFLSIQHSSLSVLGMLQHQTYFLWKIIFVCQELCSHSYGIIGYLRCPASCSIFVLSEISLSRPHC